MLDLALCRMEHALNLLHELCAMHGPGLVHVTRNMHILSKIPEWHHRLNYKALQARFSPQAISLTLLLLAISLKY